MTLCRFKSVEVTLLHPHSSWTVLWFAANSPCTLDEARQLRRSPEFRVIAADGPQLAGSNLEKVDAILITVSGVDTDRDPEELLLEARDRFPSAPVVVYQLRGSVQTGMRFQRLGAFYYLGHPAGADVLIDALRAACVTGSQAAARSPDASSDWSKTLVGNSRAMAEVVETIRLVADRRSTVLITGETGTGKEVAARALHRASSRSQRPDGGDQLRRVSRSSARSRALRPYQGRLHRSRQRARRAV